jgi:hypothetical protein
MNNFSKVRLISKATLTTIKDNPRIILQGIFFFAMMLVPIIALWSLFISQYSVAEFTELVWTFLIVTSIMWGVFTSHYFEFVVTRTLLKYWNHKFQQSNIFPKVITYTGLSFGLNTIGNIFPSVLGGVYGMTVPSITSLMPALILDNPDKSIKQTLQDNKDMFSKISGYAVFSQIYLSLLLVAMIMLSLIIFVVAGIVIFYSLDVNAAISTTMSGLEGNWVTMFWDRYVLFSILGFVISVIAILFYRVLASIIVSCSLYIWYKNGNNPEEFQKVFLEKAMKAKNAEIFFK